MKPVEIDKTRPPVDIFDCVRCDLCGDWLCPVCEVHYADCPCPSPEMLDFYDERIDIMTLSKYIAEHYDGNQAAFARYIEVAPAQVTQWLKKDVVVIDDKLYMFRRDLK